MRSPTAKLTVRLARADLESAKAYAKAHGTTVTELISRHFRRLQAAPHEPSAELLQIVGLLPSNIDGEAEYREFLAKKHGL